MGKRSYRESHLQRGADYHEIFSSLPHVAMVWNLERSLLSRIVKEKFSTHLPTHLDFACGTERILGLMSPVTASSTGVDISASMLQVARDTLEDVELLEADITRDDCLLSRKFGLITAFRFFPRAETELRRDAIAVLANHLKPGGVLIFNNHMNRHSLVRRIVVALGRTGLTKEEEAEWGMSRREARELVASVELEVEREYSLAVLPFTDRHMLRPTGLLRILEFVLSKTGLFAPTAQNLIYVCRHSRAESKVGG